MGLPCLPWAALWGTRRGALPRRVPRSGATCLQQAPRKAAGGAQGPVPEGRLQRRAPAHPVSAALAHTL